MSIIETAMSKQRRLDSLAKPPRGAANSTDALASAPRERIASSLDGLRACGAYPPVESEARILEQFRRVKRSLITQIDGDVSIAPSRRPIVITSANQSDGKTFCAVGLALSLALERDLSVVLVDGDPYVRALSQAFGVADRKGFLDLLQDSSSDPEALLLETHQPGLSILPAGGQSTLASELAASGRSRELLDRIGAGDRRRLVVVDCPPLLATTEALSHAVRGVELVLILRDGQTPRRGVDLCIDRLRQDAPASRVSVVLNHARASADDKYYSYGAYGAAKAESKTGTDK